MLKIFQIFTTSYFRLLAPVPTIVEVLGIFSRWEKMLTMLYFNCSFIILVVLVLILFGHNHHFNNLLLLTVLIFYIYFIYFRFPASFLYPDQFLSFFTVSGRILNLFIASWFPVQLSLQNRLNGNGSHM